MALLCLSLHITIKGASSEAYSVGNLSGQLTVSDMGAAVYSLTFDVPDGGPLTPQIGIAYNSQTAGYGLAGYGFNITGISCITRGGKDLFHDQTVQGVTYTDEDNYFLDGKRLILKEGQQGKDGSKYCLEGDPYTEILMHNWVKTTFVVHDPGTGDEYFEGRIPYYVPDSLVDRKDEIICWFEVKLTNGQKIEYGYTSDSKLICQNRLRENHIAAWYVNRIEDKYKNYSTYDYGTSDNSIYPLSISYGLNKSNTNGRCCVISFQYKNLGDNSRSFKVGSTNALFSKCISSIVSKINGKIHRKYDLLYDDNSDASTKKWSRLINVTEENGMGEKYPPISFDWSYLVSQDILVSQVDMQTTSERKDLQEYGRRFYGADLNGDGISDIVRVNTARLGMLGKYSYSTNVYVNISKRTPSGTIYFEEMGPWEMDAMDISWVQRVIMGAPNVIDYDGDGYNDIIIPYYHSINNDDCKKVMFNVIYGYDIAKGKADGYYQYKYSTISDNNYPLFVSFDIDGNGRDDVVCLEDKQHDGKYPGFIFKYKNRNELQQDTISFSISLPRTPIQLFSGDYNNDGLLDLLILFETGYKILYNKGGDISSLKFDDNNSSSGIRISSIKNSGIQQGDFDGDGLSDFAYISYGNVVFAKNNGNGTFSYKMECISPSQAKRITSDAINEERGGTYELVYNSKDISLKVYDRDNDGLSDIIASISYSYNYKKVNDSEEEPIVYLYDNFREETESFWLMSNGSGFIEKDRNLTTGEVSLDNLFLVDLDGDGYSELASCGKSFFSSEVNCEEGKINVYKFGDHKIQSGKILNICDSYGNCTHLEYENLTCPNLYKYNPNTSVETWFDINKAVLFASDKDGNPIYIVENKGKRPIYVKEIDGHWLIIDNPNSITKGITVGYPINSYVIPLSVVSKITRDNVSEGSRTTSYSYENLKIHIGGGGMLGFDKITTNEYIDKELISTYITTVKNRDAKRLFPIETIDSCIIDNHISTTDSRLRVVDYGGTYFAYISENEVIDLDGNKVLTSTNYDVRKGVVTYEAVVNENCLMYKEVSYIYPDSANSFGAWLPMSMTMTQQHRDDEIPFSTTTTYKYDNIGNLLSTTVNAGTDMALTTNITYDGYGNVVCSVDSGYGVVPVKQFNDYDETGRYLLRSYTEPESSVSEYAYDEMGNLISETVITNPSSPLTTTYTYDGWGRVIETLSPDGISSKTEMGWGDSDARKYYIRKTSDGQPPVTTWYNKRGFETYSETVGPMALMSLGGLSIIKSTEYNNRGQVEKVESHNGKMTMWQTFEYDERGRVEKGKSSTGKLTTYTYGNRTVTTEEDGRKHTTFTDEWGNVIKTIDPLGNEVVYNYSSQGKPRSITSLNSTVEMEYDAAGNRTKLVDPDAGTMSYTYAADGTLLSQTDGKGVKTTYTFDSLGRVIASNIGGKVITSEYGTSGNDNLRLKRQSMGGNTVEFSYDSLGRITQQVRTVGTHGVYAFDYTYNKYGPLSKTIYPGGLEVKHSYDKNGYKIKTTADGKVVYNLWQYDGLINKSKFMDLTYTVERNQKGFEVTRWISKKEKIEYTPEQLDSIISAHLPVGGGNEENGDFNTNLSEFLPLSKTIILDQFNMKFDTITCNLLSRQRHNRPWEVFEYDELDRLCAVKVDNKVLLSMQYADNGNIIQKSDVGQFSYGNKIHPHAVTRVKKRIKEEELGDELKTQFNALGKIERITDSRQQLVMNIEYGPDQQRWYSCLSENIRQYPNSTQESSLTEPSVQTAAPYRRLPEEYRSVVYAGNYEKVTEGEDIVREFYYLDNGVIVVKQNGVFTPYQAFTDNLGSVLSILNEEGEKVLDAEYDAWGNQTISKNEIEFQRGYTGHEMLNEFGIINMNGRLYDPMLGRFFSPDNYVQAPGNSQNFNRYSYCLNNPLKYTDPSGEVCGIDDAFIAFTIFSVANSMMSTYCLSEGDWRATMKSGGIALLSSAATYGIGSACSAMTNAGMSTMSVGLINAGMHGLNSGLISAMEGGNFGKGFFIGAASAGIGSFASNVHMNTGAMIACATTMGGAVAWATGGSFLEGALRGMQIGAFNHASHGEEEKEVDETIVKGLPEVIVTAKSSSNVSVVLGTTATVLWGDDATGIGVANDLFAAGVSIAAGATWLYEQRDIIEARIERAYNSMITMANKTMECRPGYVYHLVARSDGDYPNVRGGMVSLKAGDTWKIGETINGLSRYPGSYYNDLNVKMVYRSGPMTNIFYKMETCLLVTKCLSKIPIEVFNK